MLQVKRKILGYDWFSLYGLSIFLVIALGIYLRTYDFFGSFPSLWFDESWRINGLLGSKGVFYAMIKGVNNIDPLFFNLSVFLSAKIYNTESILRLNSLLPSVISIFLVYLISKKIYKTKLLVLWAVFIISFQPFLIDYAKELKPYALGLFVHLFIIYLYYNFREKNSVIYIYTFSAILLFSFFLSTTIVFLYPSIFSLLFFKYYKDSNYRGITAVIVSVGIILIFLATVTFFLIRYIPLDLKVSHLGSAFNLADTLPWYIRWVVKHYFTMINYFSIPNDLINVRPVIGIFYIFLYIAGLVLLLSTRRYEDFILLFVPVAILIVFNRFGMWPWGHVRTNLFVFGYIIFVILHGVDIIASDITGVLKPISIAVFIFILITQFPYNIEKLRVKRTAREEIRLSLNYFYNKVRHNNEPIQLMINGMAKPAFRYYTRHHKSFSKKYKEISNRTNTVSLSSRTPKKLYKMLPDIYKKFSNFWIIFSHYEPKEKRAILDKKFVQVLDKKKYRGSWVVHVKSKLYEPK